MSATFSVGQVWKYQSRQGESDSRITICQIDSDDPEYGDIVHIYVSGLEIPNAEAPGGKTVFISHMPYGIDALSESVTELDSETSELPEYEEGYQLWKDAFEDSEAGVFNVAVSEAVDFVQQTIK